MVARVGKYCYENSHDKYYCTCPSTCEICGIATDHNTAQHIERDRMDYEDWLDSLAKEDRYNER